MLREAGGEPMVLFRRSEPPRRSFSPALLMLSSFLA
jgi:hypothetical protein